ncbi:hypothetical protein GIB67_039278 [Kingdonia uniflora]|uniref:Uncharacterized protein n=1 Tax=Kingdonia uniflora TaxID=39325 RepID=A0A7J7MMA0_9MAGN|nr:hypothetical protein GIB67_039278 [Kingdonia uniflora]
MTISSNQTENGSCEGMYGNFNVDLNIPLEPILSFFFMLEFRKKSVSPKIGTEIPEPDYRILALFTRALFKSNPYKGCIVRIRAMQGDAASDGVQVPPDVQAPPALTPAKISCNHLIIFLITILWLIEAPSYLKQHLVLQISQIYGKDKKGCIRGIGDISKSELKFAAPYKRKIQEAIMTNEALQLRVKMLERNYHAEVNARRQLEKKIANIESQNSPREPQRRRTTSDIGISNFPHEQQMHRNSGIGTSDSPCEAQRHHVSDIGTSYQGHHGFWMLAGISAHRMV